MAETISTTRTAAAPTRAQRARFGLPRESRLRKRREFLRIQQHGQRVYGRRLIFQFQHGRAAESRLGITVSRKVGNAVVRNRIKRWVRESWRVHLDLKRNRAAGEAPYDLVVTAKRGVEDFSFQAIDAELVHVISRYLDNRAPSGRGRRGRGAGRTE